MSEKQTLVKTTQAHTHTHTLIIIVPASPSLFWLQLILTGLVFRQPLCSASLHFSYQSLELRQGTAVQRMLCKSVHNMLVFDDKEVKGDRPVYQWVKTLVKRSEEFCLHRAINHVGLLKEKVTIESNSVLLLLLLLQQKIFIHV